MANPEDGEHKEHKSFSEYFQLISKRLITHPSARIEDVDYKDSQQPHVPQPHGYVLDLDDEWLTTILAKRKSSRQGAVHEQVLGSILFRASDGQIRWEERPPTLTYMEPRVGDPYLPFDIEPAILFLAFDSMVYDEDLGEYIGKSTTLTCTEQQGIWENEYTIDGKPIGRGSDISFTESWLLHEQLTEPATLDDMRMLETLLAHQKKR